MSRTCRYSESRADEPPKKQEADDAEEEQDELVVSADRMEMQLDGRTVELTGNVRVEDSNMSLTALKMMVYLTEAEKEDIVLLSCMRFRINCLQDLGLLIRNR